MEMLFLLCAVFGGTVMVAQFAASFMGFGSGDDFDVADDGGAGVSDADAAAEIGADGDVIDHDPHGSTWFFGVITFRTVVAALTFFGLSGLAASTADLEDPLPIVIAIASGLAALYGVYFLMRSMTKLNADGTVRVVRTIGEEGTVYVPIPEQNKGAGKIHITVQNRLAEFEATTSGERLASGTPVIVIGVVGPDRVEVEPVQQTARNTNV